MTCLAAKIQRCMCSDLAALVRVGGALLIVAAWAAPALAGGVTSTAITIAWTAPGDDNRAGTAAQYDIRYSTVPLSVENWNTALPLEDPPVPQLAGTVETVTVADLEPATQYYIAIRAADEVPNWSPLSNVIVRRTQDAPLDPPPMVFPEDNDTVATTRPYLTAATVTDPDGDPVSYYFEVSVHADFSTLAAESDSIEPGAELTLWQTNVELTDGRQYYWRVRADADSVAGNWSQPAAFVVNIAAGNNRPTRPVVVDPADGDTLRSEPPVFIWQNASDLDGDQLGYEIEIYDSSGLARLLLVSGIGEDLGTQSYYSLTDALPTGLSFLSHEGWYRWRVRASDGSEYSSWSNSARFYRSEGIPPATISTLVAGNATLTSVTLGWIASGDDGASGQADQYDLRYFAQAITEANWNQAESATGEPTPAVAGTPQSFVITGLTPHTTYYFALKVSDDAGNWSALSNVALAVTDDFTPPDPVSDLEAATGAGLGELALSWTVPYDAAVYQIAYSRDTLTETNYQQATFWPQPPVPGTAGQKQTLILTGLVPGGEYWVAMVVIDSANNVSYVSNIVHGVANFDFGSGTDDRNEAVPEQFNLTQNYPNPFNPATTIEFALPENCQVTVAVYNVLGQLAAVVLDESRPAGVQQVVWDGTDRTGQTVASGVYFYRVQAGDHVGTKKMILAR